MTELVSREPLERLILAVKQHIAQTGETVTSLSARAGMQRSHLSSLLSGSYGHKPQFKLVSRLAHAIGRKVSYVPIEGQTQPLQNQRPDGAFSALHQVLDASLPYKGETILTEKSFVNIGTETEPDYINMQHVVRVRSIKDDKWRITTSAAEGKKSLETKDYTFSNESCFDVSKEVAQKLLTALKLNQDIPNFGPPR